MTGVRSSAPPSPPSTTPTATIAAVVVDASVWVSRLLSQDPNNATATSWVGRHVRSGGILAAPTLFAIEVGASVSRRTKILTDAHAAVSQLYALPFVQLVPIDQDLVNEAADLAIDLGLRGADSLYVALARQLAIPLVSFDREQLTLPAHLIQTIRP